METQRDTGATVSDGPVARLQRRDALSVAAATRTVMRTPPAIATEALTELCRPSERASPYCASSGGERQRSRAAPASDSAWPWAATRCSHSPSLPCCPSWHWHSPPPATAARRQRPPRKRCVATTRRGHLRRGRRHCHTRCLATRRLSVRSSRTSSISTQRGHSATTACWHRALCLCEVVLRVRLEGQQFATPSSTPSPLFARFEGVSRAHSAAPYRKAAVCSADCSRISSTTSIVSVVGVSVESLLL